MNAVGLPGILTGSRGDSADGVRIEAQAEPKPEKPKWVAGMSVLSCRGDGVPL